MTGIRRALVLATGERYVCQIVGFVLIAIVSRLLTPGEIGVSTIGSGIMAIGLAFREFATPEFLIPRKEISKDDVRTSFTMAAVVSGVIAAALCVLAPWLAAFYGEPGLEGFLYLLIVASLLDAASWPIVTLLRRDMAFGTLALINTTTTCVGAVLTLGLALLGFSYMSFAWAWLGAAIATFGLALFFKPEFWVFRPVLSSWKTALRFGRYNGVTTLLNKVYESLPQLVLGRILPLSAVGLYNRATVVCGIPDRVILAGVATVSFPALAAEVRAGRSLKEPYLQALSHITGLYWPALVLVALLAYPVVSLVLGHQWISIVPLVRIMCVASLFWFPVVLSHQLLVVVAIRDNLRANLLARPISALILCGASFFGLTALALSQLITFPFQMLVALHFVRRHIAFRWSELLHAVSKSAVVTATSAVGPIVIMASTAHGVDLPPLLALLAGLLAAAGWLAGLWLTRHPFMFEILKVLEPLVPANVSLPFTDASNSASERPQS